MRVIIRPAEIGDVPALEQFINEPQPGLHRERVLEQEAGECTYLAAWLDERPIGHLKIRWGGSVHRYVNYSFPGLVELRRLEVASEFRGQGVGSRLLDEAEWLVEQRGSGVVGLAVSTENHRARGLYERRSYSDWGLGTFVSGWSRTKADGSRQHHEHVVTYMVKELSAGRRAVA